MKRIVDYLVPLLIVLTFLCGLYAVRPLGATHIILAANLVLQIIFFLVRKLKLKNAESISMMMVGIYVAATLIYLAYLQI